MHPFSDVESMSDTACSLVTTLRATGTKNGETLLECIAESLSPEKMFIKGNASFLLLCAELRKFLTEHNVTFCLHQHHCAMSTVGHTIYVDED